MNAHKVIDIHCHLAVPETRPHAHPHRKPQYEPYDWFLGEDSRKHNEGMFGSIAGRLTDPASRLEHMDRMGVDVQGLSSFVSEYFYWTPPKLGADLAKMQNDRFAQAAADFPGRFSVCGATLPMQDIDLAIAELDRAVDELGVKGVQIGGTVNGHNLDEPRFRPFWQAVAAKGVPVIMHPNGFPESDRFGEYFLVNCIGNPLETMTAATRMIFSGLFEELPTLNLVLMHGGGYLPFYAPRADHTWKVRPETRVRIPDHAPSHYMKKLWYDSLVFQPQYLRFLLDVVGTDRVMLGTDFPFDMSETDPVGVIDAVPGLADDERRAIKGDNAARLFRL